jgi:hypothetical protein
LTRKHPLEPFQAQAAGSRAPVINGYLYLFCYAVRNVLQTAPKRQKQFLEMSGKCGSSPVLLSQQSGCCSYQSPGSTRQLQVPESVLMATTAAIYYYNHKDRCYCILRVEQTQIRTAANQMRKTPVCGGQLSCLRRQAARNYQEPLVGWWVCNPFCSVVRMLVLRQIVASKQQASGL